MGGVTLLFIILSIISIIVCLFLSFILNKNMAYRFVTDSNQFLAFAVSFCSFMYFNNLQIKNHSRSINLFGKSTFGVLLIHTSSDAMRSWLWGDVCKVKYVFHFPFYKLLVFIICSIIDIVRQKFIEQQMLNRIQLSRLYKRIDNWISSLVSN